MCDPVFVSVLTKLLESLPFHMIFYNGWSYSGDRTLALKLLEKKMDSMTKYPLSCALSLTLQRLALIIINEGDGADTDSLAIDFCLGLIQHGLHLINKSALGEQDKADLKYLIFDHPAISHLTRALATLLHRLSSTSTYSSALDPNVSNKGPKGIIHNLIVSHLTSYLLLLVDTPVREVSRRIWGWIKGNGYLGRTHKCRL